MGGIGEADTYPPVTVFALSRPTRRVSKKRRLSELPEENVTAKFGRTIGQVDPPRGMPRDPIERKRQNCPEQWTMETFTFSARSQYTCAFST